MLRFPSFYGHLQALKTLKYGEKQEERRTWSKEEVLWCERRASSQDDEVQLLGAVALALWCVWEMVMMG